MSKHFFILICFLPLFISSCRDETYDFPKTLRKSEERRVEKVRLFVGGKEVYDQVMINDLYNLDICERYQTVSNSGVLRFTQNFPDSMCFTSQSAATVGEGIFCSVIMDKDLVRLKTNTQNYSFLSMDGVSSNFTKYKPKAVYGSNYTYGYLIGHGDYNCFEFSVLHYKYFTGYSHRNYAEEGVLNNELTDKLSLTIADTLLVEEYRLVYK